VSWLQNLIFFLFKKRKKNNQKIPWQVGWKIFMSRWITCPQLSVKTWKYFVISFWPIFMTGIWKMSYFIDQTYLWSYFFSLSVSHGNTHIWKKIPPFLTQNTKKVGANFFSRVNCGLGEVQKFLRSYPKVLDNTHLLWHKFFFEKIY
jgi:hypothetical protein